MGTRKANKKRKYIKSIKSSKKSKKWLIVIIISVVLLTCISFIILLRSSALLRVEVRGLNRLNAVDIINQSGVSVYNNKNLFFLPKDGIQSNIERNKLIKVLDIKIAIPDLLIIEVEERDTIALLEHEGRIYEVVNENYLIINNLVVNYNVPYITGLKIETGKETIENEYTKYIIDLLNKLKKDNKDVYDTISEINGFGDDLIIYPRIYRTKVLVEKYVKEEKIIELAAILKALQERDEYVSEIDFRFNEAIIREQ